MKILTILVVLAALFALGGCGSSTPKQPAQSPEKEAASWVHAGWVATPGGTKVMCAYTGSGGVDCDWPAR